MARPRMTIEEFQALAMRWTLEQEEPGREDFYFDDERGLWWRRPARPGSPEARCMVIKLQPESGSNHVELLFQSPLEGAHRDPSREIWLPKGVEITPGTRYRSPFLEGGLGTVFMQYDTDDSVRYFIQRPVWKFDVLAVLHTLRGPILEGALSPKGDKQGKPKQPGSQL